MNSSLSLNVKGSDAGGRYRLCHALFAFMAFAGLSIAGNSQARAQIDYPYCMKVYSSISWYTQDCSFSTMAQCQMSASGRGAECYRDPFYKGKPGSAYYVGPTYRHNLDGIYDPYAVPAQQAVPARRHTKRKHRAH